MGKVTERQEIPVSDLVPYANNARTHDEKQIDLIARSIEEFGFLNPILIDRDKNVIAGHGRILAAKKLGMKTIPVLFVEGLTEEQRRAYVLADNRLTELGGWDEDLLNAELDALQEAGFDTGIVGFDWDKAAALDPITETFETAQDILGPVEEKPAETKTKRGDVWILGQHRLVCGDSTDPDDMDRLFEGGVAHLAFTDPPYGVAIGSKNKAINAVEPGRGGLVEEDIEGDTLSPDELYDELVKAFTNLRTRCAEDCSYYVTAPQGGDLGMLMLKMMSDAGLAVRHNLVWIKSSPVFSMGRLDYDYRHEPVFYTWTKKHNFYGGYDNTIIDDNQRLEDLSKEELKELVHALKRDGSTTAIYCDKPKQSKLHPTMKPLKLIQRFVYNSSQEGDTVADIFGGSGSTMIVCEKMNRRCLMMELDPHYCDVIVERWEQFTGRKAEKENV